MYANKKKANPWIGTAAYELDVIRKRWHLTSDRQFAQAIAMNARTVAKLNPRHPDGSLTLETVDRIYSILIALCRREYKGEEMEEEYRRLTDSRMRIAMSVAPLPPSIQAQLDDAKER